MNIVVNLYNLTVWLVKIKALSINICNEACIYNAISNIIFYISSISHDIWVTQFWKIWNQGSGATIDVCVVLLVSYLWCAVVFAVWSVKWCMMWTHFCFLLCTVCCSLCDLCSTVLYAVNCNLFYLLYVDFCALCVSGYMMCAVYCVLYFVWSTMCAVCSVLCGK